jgi:hypothetical protein
MGVSLSVDSWAPQAYQPTTGCMCACRLEVVFLAQRDDPPPCTLLGDMMLPRPPDKVGIARWFEAGGRSSVSS